MPWIPIVFGFLKSYWPVLIGAALVAVISVQHVRNEWTKANLETCVARVAAEQGRTKAETARATRWEDSAAQQTAAVERWKAENERLEAARGEALTRTIVVTRARRPAPGSTATVAQLNAFVGLYPKGAL